MQVIYCQTFAWFHFLKYENLMLFFDLHYCKLRTFVFWIVGQTKQAICKCHFGLW